MTGLKNVRNFKIKRRDIYKKNTHSVYDWPSPMTEEISSWTKTEFHNIPSYIKDIY